MHYSAPAPLETWEITSIRNMIKTGLPSPPPKGTDRGAQKRMLALHQYLSSHQDPRARQMNFLDAAKKAGFPENIEEFMMGVSTGDVMKDNSCQTMEDVGRIVGSIGWYWSGWFPKGLLTMLVAPIGEMKTFVVHGALTRVFTTGCSWPDGSPYTGKIMKVVLAETENGHSGNLERYDAMGIPRNMILVPFRKGENPLDDVRSDDPERWALLEKLMLRDDVAALIVDAMRGFHTRDENSTEAALVTKKLSGLLENTGKGGILLHHTNKPLREDKSGLIDISRMRGSSAIGQYARCIWGIERPDETTETRRLRVIKSNYGVKPDPLGVKVVNNATVFCKPPQAPKKETSVDRAKEHLLTALKAGPVPAVELIKTAAEKGISEGALYKAKEAMGIVHPRQGYGAGSKVVWSLPYREDKLPYKD